MLLVIFALIVTICGIIVSVSTLKEIQAWSVSPGNRIRSISAVVIFAVFIVILWMMVPVRTSTEVLNENNKIITIQKTELDMYSVVGSDTLLVTSVPKIDTISVTQTPDSVYLECETQYTIYGQTFLKHIKNYGKAPKDFKRLTR